MGRHGSPWGGAHPAIWKRPMEPKTDGLMVGGRKRCRKFRRACRVSGGSMRNIPRRRSQHSRRAGSRFLRGMPPLPTLYNPGLEPAGAATSALRTRRVPPRRPVRPARTRRGRCPDGRTAGVARRSPFQALPDGGNGARCGRPTPAQNVTDSDTPPVSLLSCASSSASSGKTAPM